MSAAGKIMVARSNLILTQPFFATLALKLEVVPTRRIKTFATDAVHLFYNPDFVDKLPLAQVEGAICHEVLHCAAGHCWRRDGRQQKKWNEACDYAINPIVLESRFKLPDGILLDKKFEGMSAEQIYGLLPDSPGSGETGNGSGGIAQPGSDSDGSQGNPGASQGDKKDDAGNGLIPEDHDPSVDILDTPREKAPEVAADWNLSTLQAAKAAKAVGKLPAGLEREMMEAIRPKVDWRALMRKFFQETARNDYTWRRPSTRYASMGLYLPIMKSEQMPPVVIAIDTSGSVGEAEMAAFKKEVEAIVDECVPQEVHVIYADAAVGRADRFEAGEPLTFKAVGGGGTDFRPAFRHVKNEGIEPACFVYLTDMYGPFPMNEEIPDYPVMWVATTDIVAPFGETVRMDM